MSEFRDIFGAEIRVGDIVARAIYSSHTFHKVLKLTPKGIILSRGHSTREYRRYEYIRNPDTGRYERSDEFVIHEYTVYGGASSEEGVSSHNGQIYLSKENISLVLVL